MGKFRSLKKRIADQSILKHPFYRAWGAGLLTKEDLRRYAFQYYHHVRAFPTYVAGIIANCDDPRLRGILFENLQDEEGQSPTHLDLWVEFGRSLGLSREEMENAEAYPQTREFVENFRKLTRQNTAPVGAAALYAYESQIPAVAAEKIRGLKNYAFGCQVDVAYFKVHQEADVRHTAGLEAVMGAVRPDQEAQSEFAVAKVLNGWWGLLDGVLERSVELKEKVATGSV